MKKNISELVLQPALNLTELSYHSKPYKTFATKLACPYLVYACQSCPDCSSRDEPLKPETKRRQKK